MDYAQVKDILADLSLNLDIETIERVHHLLAEEVGLLGDRLSQRLVVYAAAAVVAESEMVPTLDRHLSSSGITIEHIVNHLEPSDIEPFLALVEKVIEKCRTNNANLRWKVDRMRVSYRIFSKYEEIVKSLATQFQFESGFQEDLRRLVWVLFCSCKFSSPKELPIDEEVLLLQECLVFMVEQLQRAASPRMQEYLIRMMHTTFPHATMHSRQQSVLFAKLCDDALRLREHSFADHMPAVLHEECSRRRFVDDMINQGQRLKYQHTDPHIIDEVKYLRMNKSQPLPPERICHEFETPTKFSSCRIDFDKLEFDEGEPSKENTMESTASPATNFSRFKTSMLVSPLIKRPQVRPFELSPTPQKSMLTPVSARMSSCNWANKHCSSLSEVQMQKLLQLFSEVGADAYEHTRSILQLYASKVIRQHCRDAVESRIAKLLNLAEYLLLAMARSPSNILNHNIEEIRSSGYLRAFLCVACSMYFSAHSLKCPDIKQLAQEFDSSYLDVFPLLNQVSKADPDMPVPLKQHLDELERHILIVSIWEDGTGYRLICGEHNGPLDRILEDRLQRHIYSRIYEIHRTMGLQQNQTDKVKEVVAYVLNEKPQLLHQNYIDQIILCSLFAVLRLTLHEAAPSLEEVFRKYSTLQLSFNFYKLRVHGKEGQELNLLEFYNGVFRPEVREALNHEYISRKLLSAPVVKQEPLFRVGNVQATPLTCRLSHNPQDTSFFDRNRNKARIDFNNSSELSSKPRSNYRTDIVRQISEKVHLRSPVAEVEESEEGMNSPRFPDLRLQHKFSFGAPQSQAEESPHPFDQNSITFGFSRPNIEDEEKD